MYSACIKLIILSGTGSLRGSNQSDDSLSTESKTDFKSTYATRNGCPYSLLVWIRVFNIRILPTVDRPGVMPLCSRHLDSNSLVLMRDRTMKANTFTRIESRVITLYFLHSLRMPLLLYSGRMMPFLQSGGICPVSQAPCITAMSPLYYPLPSATLQGCLI